MLRLIIPVSSVDAHLALALLNHLSDPSDSARGRPILLVLTRSVAKRSEEFLTAARKVSNDVELFVCPNEEESGWPMSANHLFRLAVGANSSSTLPWLWLEADCTPLTRDWVNQILTEYNACERPFMGTARPTRLVDAEGKQQGTDGEHLIGVAVYPSNFNRRSLLWNYAHGEPWDVYCRWEIRPAAHVSELFAHTWRASKFRGDREKGFVWDGDDQTAIPANAVLHHGCKDGSLLAAVWNPKPAAAPASSKKPIPVIKLEVPEDDDGK